MDPTKYIKALFGDLLMQIAILQQELEDCKRQLQELNSTNNNQ